MTTALDERHHFSRAEYLKMGELGFFDDQRVELIEGVILDLPPRGEPHEACVSRIMRVLNRALPDEFEVYCHSSYGASETSEPEPDIYVIRTPIRPPAEIATNAILLIEVAVTSLAWDRQKIAIYAAGGVQEYWIVDLNARRIEQYTNPDPARGEFGNIKVLNAADMIACGTLPLPAQQVAMFLPK